MALLFRGGKPPTKMYVLNLINKSDASVYLPLDVLNLRLVLKSSIQQFHINQTKRKSVSDNYRSKRIGKEVPQCIDHYYYICRRKIGGLLDSTDNIVFEDVNQQFLTHPSEWMSTDVQIENSLNAVWKGADSLGRVLYTDASKSTHGIGWGFVAFQNGFCVYRSFGALTKCSICVAEAYALLQTTIYAGASIVTNQKEIIEIRTDSQGLAWALEKEHHSDRILVNIKSELRKMYNSSKKVQIRWVPSHQNIYGNDVADKLAKKATDNRYQVRMAVRNRDLKQFLKNKERMSKTDAWSNFQSRNVKYFLPDIDSVHRFLKSKPFMSLCQIVSGHTRLNDFVCEKLGLIKSPKYKCMKANETITHFLLECDLYDNIRKEIWPDFESSYAYILKDWNLLNEFVVKTKMFHHTVRDALLENSEK